MAAKKSRRSAKSRANDAHRVLWCILTIAGAEWKVFLVDPEAFGDQMKNEHGEPAQAVTHDEVCLILISWHLSPSLAEAALIHEILHARSFTMGSNKFLSYTGKDVSHEEEETVVSGTAPAIYDDLNRNGMLVFPPRPKIPVAA